MNYIQYLGDGNLILVPFQGDTINVPNSPTGPVKEWNTIKELLKQLSNYPNEE